MCLVLLFRKYASTNGNQMICLKDTLLKKLCLVSQCIYMTNLYPMLFDYKENDELYLEKVYETLLLLKRKQLEMVVTKKSKDSILIKNIELEKGIMDIIMSLNTDNPTTKTLKKAVLYAEKFKNM